MPKINPHILTVNRIRTPYSRTDIPRLHASERDMPYSAELWNSFLDRVNDTHVRYYPDNGLTEQLIAQFSGFPIANINAYSGSDRALRDLFTVFGVPDTECVIWDESFPMYRVYAEMHGLKVVHAVADRPKRPFTVSESGNTTKKDVFFHDDSVADRPKRPFTVSSNSIGNENNVLNCASTVAVYPKRPLATIRDSINTNTSIVILSNPDTPWGNTYSRDELIQLINTCKQFDCLLIVDEAYIEFATSVSTIADLAIVHDNVVVTRTLSKAFGSAGIRIGYTISNSSTSELLYKACDMNTITGIGNCWLSTCIEYKAELDLYYSTVIANRERLRTHCCERSIIHCVGETNFVHLIYDIGDAFVTRTVGEFTRISIPAGSAFDDLIGVLR